MYTIRLDVYKGNNAIYIYTKIHVCNSIRGKKTKQKP